MNYFLLTPGIALSKYSMLTTPMIADIEQLLETKVLQIEKEGDTNKIVN